MGKVSNDRLADHPEAPGDYLRQVKTSVDGSYSMLSIDPDKRMTITGFQTSDGAFQVNMTKGDGELNQSSTNGVKTFFDSSTSTTTGHSDNNVGGGESNRNGQGGHQEDGGDSTKATQGTNQGATSDSKNDISKGGNGKHQMNGDQTFVVEDGGIFYNLNDFNVNASKTASMAAQQDIFLSSAASLSTYSATGSDFASSKDINITSSTKITLSVGDSSIVITNDGITIKSKNGTITVEGKSNVIKSKSGTALEASSVPPLPWDGS